MASTYTWQDAISFVSQQKQRTYVDSAVGFAVNMTQNALWEAFDWRETLGDLPPFWLNPKFQDYGSPVVEIPDDFLGLRQAWLIDVDGRLRRELTVKGKINQTTNWNIPSDIGYVPEKQAFRVWPKPPDGVGWTRWLIEGIYKKLPVKLTLATLNTPIPWDDRYFTTVTAGLEWALTPTSQVQERMQNFSVFRAMVQDMAKKEGFELGAPQGIAPQNPLVRWYVR
jgi:hypothetical protein